MSGFIKKEVVEIKEELIEIRRFLHKNAEIKDELTVTSNFIKHKLESFGYDVSVCSKSGLTCMVGDPNAGKVILLRADMDALPMIEENDLPFKSITDNSHCCGHDLHTTMLLGVAKILKKHENELCGAVKFMFQPDEETGHGAKNMIDNGILANPEVDIAFAMHVDALTPLGIINYGRGSTFASNDNFDIIIKGKSSHGARPHEGIDPIDIFVHLYSLFQSYITREKNPMDNIIFSITSVNSGSSYNIIPDILKAKASLRTYDNDVRNRTLNRFESISRELSNLYNTEIVLSTIHTLPALTTNEDITNEFVNYISESLGENHTGKQVVKMGSEDFAYVTNKIPSAYFFLGAGKNEHEGYEFGQHTTKVIFNEEALVYGVTFMVYSTMRWLEKNKIGE